MKILIHNRSPHRNHVDKMVTLFVLSSTDVNITKMITKVRTSNRNDIMLHYVPVCQLWNCILKKGHVYFKKVCSGDLAMIRSEFSDPFWTDRYPIALTEVLFFNEGLDIDTYLCL